MRTTTDDNLGEHSAERHTDDEPLKNRARLSARAPRIVGRWAHSGMLLRTERRRLAGLALLSLLLRLVMLTQEQVLTPDGTFYVTVARQFATGYFRSGLSAYSTPLYPLLISAASFLCGDLELSGRLVSILAGGLLVLPVYSLIRMAYGRRVAMWGSVLVAVHPLLIYYSAQVLTESTYTLFFICGLLAGYQALAKRRTGSFVQAGLSFGLCYLLKPEAIGFIILLLALTIACGLKSRAVAKKSLLANCCWLLGSFLLLALPYLLYVRHETGVWTISGKIYRHMWQGSRLGEVGPSDGLVPGWPIIFAQTARALRSEYEILNLIFPPTVVALAALGLFRRRWTRRRARFELYLLLFLSTTLAGYAITLPNIRFFVPLVPLTAGWVARGAVESERWLHQTIRGRSRKKDGRPGRLSWFGRGPLFGRSSLFGCSLYGSLVVALVALSLVPLFVYLMRGDKWSDYGGQRRAALWIKERESSRRAPVIMATSPIAPFYAGGMQVEIDDEDYAAFLARARNSKADYIIINERDIKRTRLWPLLHEDAEHPGLRLVYQETNAPEHKILVYILAD